MEAKAASAEALEEGTALPMAPVRLDEEASPTAGRRFTRA